MGKETNYEFLVWIDYGTEGWSPHGFDSLEDAVAFMQTASSESRVLTRRMVLTARDAAQLEFAN